MISKAQRETQEYKGYKIYPEIHYLKGLTDEQRIVFGMIYNITGGKVRCYKYIHGKNVNKLTQGFMKQQYKDFNLKKPLTRPKWMPIVDDLLKMNWIYQVDVRREVGKWGERVMPAYELTEMAWNEVKFAIKLMDQTNSGPDVTPLF